MVKIRVDYHRLKAHEPAVVVVREDESFTIHNTVKILGPALITSANDPIPRVWVETDADLEVT